MKIALDYDKTKKYLIEFDCNVGERGEYNIRVIGILEGIYAPIDCPSGKSLAVTYSDSLTNVVNTVWVDIEDNPRLIEVDYNVWDYYDILLTGDDVHD